MCVTAELGVFGHLSAVMQRTPFGGSSGLKQVWHTGHATPHPEPPSPDGLTSVLHVCHAALELVKVAGLHGHAPHLGVTQQGSRNAPRVVCVTMPPVTLHAG
jgi:hypothetical protein